MAFLHSQDVKAANKLFEHNDNASCNFFLAKRQNDRKSNFFAIRIPLHFPIHRGRLSRLCMSVVWSYRVHLHICALRFHKFLVNVRPIATNFVDVRIEFGRSVSYFAEELLAAPTCRCWIVDGNVVVFGVYRLFNKWLVDLNALDFNVIVVFLHFLVPRSISVSRSTTDVTITRQVHVAWYINTRVFQQIINFSTILQCFLHIKAVENHRLT
mmetsp:Transcript_18134/g.49489  ORF Transcript_18134/g.49489 Transcript_18134/m.49489 type:complete len:212 (-) Transcript_18134:744-1379(-)